MDLKIKKNIYSLTVLKKLNNLSFFINFYLIQFIHIYYTTKLLLLLKLNI